MNMEHNNPEKKAAKKPRVEKKFHVWIPQFLGTQEFQNYSPRTQKTYRTLLTSFARYKKYLDENNGKRPKKFGETRWMGTGGRVETTPEEVLDYLALIRGENNTRPSTIRLYLIILGCFYRYLHQRGVVKTNPIDEIPLPKVKGTERMCLKHEEVMDLIASIPDERNALIVRTIYATGVRAAELCGMRVEDIDFSEQTIRVVGKGGKIRRVFCDRETLRMLEKYLDGRCKGPVFLARGGYGITQDRIGEIFRQNAPKGVTPHVIRHSHATELYQKSHDLRLVQKCLGHESIKTTEIYLHSDQETEKKAYMQFFPLNAETDADGEPETKTDGKTES